jgi:hypothetical protein
MLADGPTLPMVMALFGEFGVMRHCVEVGFDVAIADSSSRSIAHFAAAGDSIEIFTALVEAFRELRFDLLHRAGQSAADYAALMDRAVLLEVLLSRDSPRAVRDDERTVVLPMMAFLWHIKATFVLVRRDVIL